MATESITADTAAAPPSRGLLALFVVAFLACCAAAMALPHDRYIRYQQFDGTIMKPLEWDYERLHYDRTPIDIAIIGSSRTRIGLSAPQIEAILSARFGRPVHVANLSMLQDGRDLHYALTKELLATHPEVKLILYSLVEHASRTGHPTFPDIADVRDVLHAPVLINPSYFSNLAFQPYRQLSLFLQTQAPGWFGRRRAFDPRLYAGPDVDTTLSQRSLNGKLIDRNAIVPQAVLAKAAKGKVSLRSPVFLPARFRDYEYAIERRYTQAVTTLARRRGIQIGFVYQPVYAHDMPISDLAFYRARGFIMNAGVIAQNSTDYSDYAHLNRNGSTTMSRWVAGRLAALEQKHELHFLPGEGAR